MNEKLQATLQSLGRQSWFRWVLVIGGSSLLVLVALLFIGFAYQSIALRLDTRRYPPPGELVEVNGANLHIYCTGDRRTDRPTVILVAGSGSSSADWALVQPEIASATRVCSYDRAGLGWSDPAVPPRTSQDDADELHQLLLNAGETGPYVLVGHSLGGHAIRIFTEAHPDEVAGMILIDPRLIDDSTNPLAGEERSAGNLIFWGLMARFGFFRLFGPFVYPAVFRENMPDHPYGFLMSSTYFETNVIEAEGIVESDLQAQETGPFGDLPLAVITSDIPDMFGAVSPEETPILKAYVLAGHTEMAELSSQGRLITAEGCGHFIMIEDPDLVAEEILEMVGNQ